MLSFFPRGVLDEILNLIESVSEVFFLPTFFIFFLAVNSVHCLSKADKNDIVYNEKISYFSLVMNVIDIFSLYEAEAILTIKGLISSRKALEFVSGITLRVYPRQIKQLTSHFDVTFELT